MSNKWGVKSEQAEVLLELENKIGESIPLVEDLEGGENGAKTVEGNIIVLRLDLSTLESVRKIESVIQLGIEKNINQTKSLPESIGNLKSLQELDLRSIELNILPESLGNLQSLKKLAIRCPKVPSLPESIGELSSLQALDLSANNLTTLPDSIGNLRSLQKLNLSDCNVLKSIPESIGDLKRLQKLELTRCFSLETLPNSIGDLKSLQVLNLKLCINLKSIPEELGNLQSLIELNMCRLPKIETLPESIGNLKSLQNLLLGFERPSTFEIFKSKYSTKVEKVMKQLKKFNNKLEYIKPDYDQDQSLINDNNNLKTLPNSVGNLKSLILLDLDGCKLLDELPKSIGELKSLQSLFLSESRLKKLPESIGNLQSLQTLYLPKNELITLPESIGNLQSLQILNLADNKLTTIPESIANMHSLQVLDLSDNELTSLPSSLWKLINLEIITLDSNFWEGEWKELALRDAITLRRILKQRVSINIFISHTVNEFSSYRIKELAEYLEQQVEINQVFFCEEDLKGNIDTWMEETVPKSHLLLFIGTQQSIFNSRDCSNELFLARKHNIEVTPIKGIDANWEDLTKVGLSRELGFEFDEKKFNKLCENLYTYICDFKRERDLLSKETDKVLEYKSRLLSLIKDNIDKEDINKIFSDNFSLTLIKLLEVKHSSNKITFIEFLKRLTDILS